MADHRTWFHTVGTPECRQRQLHAEQHRLDPHGALHRLTVGHYVMERKSQLRNEVGLQFVDGGRKCRLIDK